MSRFKRGFKKAEAEEIKPYLQYFAKDADMETLYKCLENGLLFRTPVIKQIAANYKIANPNEPLPNCLKI